MPGRDIYDLQLEGCADDAGVGLADELTVFVTTVGAPAFADCLDHLRTQDCRFRLTIIDRVAPLSAAFQCMIDRCETPLFVQVDEDMILEPHAIRTLFDYISAAGPEAAMFTAPLHDADVDRQIHGLKVYRHAIIRNYPVADIEGSEIDLLRRIAADGFGYVRTAPADDPGYDESSEYDCGYFFARGPTNAVPPSPGPLGRHGTKWTPTLLYERYFTIERKWQSGRARLRWYPGGREELLKRFMRDPTEENFLVVMGIVAGALTKDMPRGEKDFRTYDDLPGLAEMRALYRELREGDGDAD
ncbi:MAG: hypothetical protein GY791_11025 [Alphaproteobacteria bacterium]|nr:hypothetical protein [Alphaproteobacteria bacterium]